MSTEDPHQAELPKNVASAIRAHVPEGERVVWVGRPSVRAAVEGVASDRWHRAAILGGGYSLLIGAGLVWFTARWEWLAAPLAWIGTCGFGIWREHQKLQRLRAMLDGITYVLTVQRALVIRDQSELEVQAAKLSDVTPKLREGRSPAIRDVVLESSAGQAIVVFKDLEDGASACELITRLKAEPEAMDQQFALLEYWAKIRDGLG